MQPYVLTQLPPSETKLFYGIETLVADLPEIDLGVDEEGQKIELSCHILARAVGRVFGLKVVDGYFGVCCEHSWLLTTEHNILDVYPVGTLGGPLLIDKFVPGIRNVYKPISTRVLSHGRFSRPSFRRAVQKVSRALEY